MPLVPNIQHVEKFCAWMNSSSKCACTKSYQLSKQYQHACTFSSYWLLKMAAICKQYDSSSNEEETSLLLLLLRRRWRHLRAAHRTVWTKRWISRQLTQGVCENIVCELSAEDAEQFRQYHRLERGAYEQVLALVLPLIERQDNHLRCCLKPMERLSVTLRFLATGLKICLCL